MKWFFHIMTVFLLLTLALVTHARRQNSGAWIAFESNREGHPGIYLMTGDGGIVRRITPQGMCGIEPRWSPGGGWIAFANSCTYSRDVWRIRPGGATPHIVARALPYAQPGHWSPDEQHVIVTRDESDLYLVNAEAGEERLLAGAYSNPLWSLDGTQIYASPFASPRSQLDRIDIATGEAQTLFREARFANPGWSPDGAQMVLVMQTPDGDALFVMNADGTSQNMIPLELAFPRLAEPQWSPDGEWIAFLGGETYIEQHIYRVRPDGRDLQRLTDRTGDVLNVGWSPDGAWLLFAANYERSWDIFRLRADGSSLENLTPQRDRDLLPQYAPVFGKSWHPLWLTLAAVGVLMLSVVRRSRL